MSRALWLTLTAALASGGCARFLESDPAVGSPGGPCAVGDRCNGGLSCAFGVCVRSDAPPNDAGGGEILPDLPEDSGGDVAADAAIDSSAVDAKVYAELLPADALMLDAPKDAALLQDAAIAPDKQTPPDHGLAEMATPDLTVQIDLTLKCSIWSSWECTGLSSGDAGLEGCFATCGDRVIACNASLCTCTVANGTGTSCPGSVVIGGCNACHAAFVDGCCAP